MVGNQRQKENMKKKTTQKRLIIVSTEIMKDRRSYDYFYKVLEKEKTNLANLEINTKQYGLQK